MMARAESPATQLIRKHMDKSLEEINLLLVAEGLPSYPSKKAWQKALWRIRTKAPVKTTGDRKPSKANKTPSRGTIAEFAVTFPYDMPAKMVVERARANGLEATVMAVYKARQQYPHLRKLSKASRDAVALAPPAAVSSDEIVKIPNGAQKRITLNARRAQLAALVLHMGLDAVQEVVDDFKRVNERFEKGGE